MSSPPSLASLNISSPPPPQPQQRPSSTHSVSSDDSDNPKTESVASDVQKAHINGNGEHGDSSSPNSTNNSPPLPSEQLPKPVESSNVSSPPSRPTPPTNFVSAPALPNARAPSAGASMAAGGGTAGRGGMPMAMRGPMGMRGPQRQMESRVPASLQAKMDRIAGRGGNSPAPAPSIPVGGGQPSPSAASFDALLRSQALGGGQTAQGPNAGPLGLAARRAMAGGPPRPTLGPTPGSTPGRLNRPGAPNLAGRRGPPGGLSLSGITGAPKAEESNNKFTDFKTIMDPSGSLRFSKAVLHANGVDFDDGISFKINLGEIDVIGELGRGNYGSVQKVFHRPTQVEMAMKEIRLELDESKLNGIIMELDILHRARAPEIVEFFGAFTVESCVYYCMELMDAGSLDALTGGGQPAKAGEKDLNDEGATERVPEDVLRRITAAMIRGLKFLKDELQIMHRDVKPTNVLINKKGEVKLCDFGVSGQLEKSLAKTNIGCQSYMAPERIAGESQNKPSTYTVSSDVWSVGLTIIELAKGCYPYPPETFANVFAQLSAIVHGAAPTLPKGYSDDANDFIAKCLMKDANARPTYAQLLEHPFLLADKGAEVDMVGWVNKCLERKATRGVTPLQAL